jgi:hypothetical protein
MIDLDKVLADRNCDFAPDGSTGAAYDMARLSRMRFYGTDWNAGALGNCSDFIDVKNVRLVLYPPACPSDIDDDGSVSLSDLALLLSNYGRNTLPIPVFATDFEAYLLGDLPSQDGWVDDTTDPGFGMVQVVDDPTGAGHGKVINIDPPGIDINNWQGAFREFTPTDNRFVFLEWDQYRTGLTDNFYVADSLDYMGWWAMQWDVYGAAFPYRWEGGGAPLTAGQWQHITYELDTLNFVAKVTVAGQTRYASFALAADTAIGGIDFEMNPTESGGEDGPMYIDNVQITQKPAIVLAGDIDQNGQVDLSDLALLLSNFGCVP